MSFVRKTVAIVDDDESVLDATSEFVRSLGHDTLSFNSGEQFLRSDDKGRVSHLLTDVNMPGMTGLELQEIVRNTNPDIAVIMMTALRDEAVGRRARAAGAIGVLRKPIIGDDLIRCLDVAC